jgi:hypothetical protein
MSGFAKKSFLQLLDFRKLLNAFISVAKRFFAISTEIRDHRKKNHIFPNFLAQTLKSVRGSADPSRHSHTDFSVTYLVSPPNSMYTTLITFCFFLIDISSIPVSRY